MTGKERSRAWYLKNRSPELLAKMRERSKVNRRAEPKRRLLAAAKARSKAGGIPFSITLEDFEYPDCCPILGTKFEVGCFRRAPSLDRIDPKKGYVPGNVWVISRKANVMKNDATLEELKAFGNWLNTLTIS